MIGKHIVVVLALLAVPTLAAPPTPRTSLAFAAAAARTDQNKLAARLYRDATRANPLDAEAWFGLGRALDADDQLGEALAALQRAGELRPGLPGLSKARGRSELRAGNLVAAETAFRAATVEAAADPRGWVGLGVALDLQKRHAEAQSAYAGALRADPLDRSARNNLALSVALQGQPGQAAALLEPWASADDAPTRMRANLLLLRAAASQAGTPAAGVDPAMVAALRSLPVEARP